MSNPDEPTIRTRVWRRGVLEHEDFPFEQVSDHLADPDCLVWADLLHPDAAVLAQLADELGLDPHAVEDAASVNERPKTTRYRTHLFLTASPVRFDAATQRVVTGRVSVFITKQAMVTVRLDDTLDLAAVLDRWDSNTGVAACGPRGLLHGVLDEIVDRYLDVLDDLDDEVEAIEDLLFDGVPASPREVPHRTFVLRRALVAARRAMVPMRDVVMSVRRGVGNDQHAIELTPFYDDLVDHIMHVGDTLEMLRDSMESVFDTTTALSDNRMNTIMKKLTSWAAIIAVPTAITGFYGQNVPYPGFGHVWGFWASLVLIVVIAVGLYGSFKRRDWL